MNHALKHRQPHPHAQAHAAQSHERRSPRSARAPRRDRGWLNGRGVRQWPVGGFPAERISPLIAEGVLYLLDGERGEERPAATIALDGHADPEFWAPEDGPGTALYVHKLSVARGYSGRGLGEALLDWAGLRVLATRRRWLRLDCSKDNPRLQDYYRGQRFAHLRTVDLPHRASGALFQRAGAFVAGRPKPRCRSWTVAGCSCRSRSEPRRSPDKVIR
ncbi:GNAT family N-acetyltransferase [Streptosporangium lutulentum]